MGRLTVVSPAPFFQTREILQASIGIKPRLGQIAALQLAQCVTVAIVDEAGRVLVVLGFWPTGDGSDEVFLVGREADELVPDLVRLTRLARLIIAARLHSGSMALIGFVRWGHEPGRRLARLAGFEPCPADGAPPAFERWVATHGKLDSGPVRRRAGQGRQGGAAGT